MRKKERMEDETYEEERNGGRRKIAQLMSLIPACPGDSSDAFYVRVDAGTWLIG